MLTALSWAALLSYLTALTLLWQYTTNTEKHTASIRAAVIVATIIGLILHAIELYIRVIHHQLDLTGPAFELGHSISLVAIVATILFVIISMLRSTLNLGLVILPTTILGLFAGRWLNPEQEIFAINQPGIEWHLVIGIITFGVLSLAFAQSLLILIQDNQLRTHAKPKTGFSLVSLPALQSMETLLFQLLWLGFFILSATLVLGMLANKAQYGSAFVFNHHIVLTLATWTAYAILLGGRYFAGWRGRHASIYTIICYSLFVLGYFGPRIVRELIIS